MCIRDSYNRNAGANLQGPTPKAQSPTKLDTSTHTRTAQQHHHEHLSQRSSSGCASASRNLFTFSNRDPENGPEKSEFLYLCGYHWNPVRTKRIVRWELRSLREDEARPPASSGPKVRLAVIERSKSLPITSVPTRQDPYTCMHTSDHHSVAYG